MNNFDVSMTARDLCSALKTLECVGKRYFVLPNGCENSFYVLKTRNR